MQAAEENISLHSCFNSLKTAVMGCCYSICHKDNDPEVFIRLNSAKNKLTKY